MGCPEIGEESLGYDADRKNKCALAHSCRTPALDQRTGCPESNSSPPSTIVVGPIGYVMPVYVSQYTRGERVRLLEININTSITS